MDFTVINEVLGLASSAVGLTGKATTTIAAIKGLLDDGKGADSGETAKLLNTLASELTTVNIMNVQLSESLRKLSQQLQREDEFERERSRYELFRTGQNDFVFKLRENMAEGEPVHFVCPVCLKTNRLFIFISGEGDYKSCQANNQHLFRFKDTPLSDFRRDYNPLDF